jgi:UDP-galactopyranose mutase
MADNRPLVVFSHLRWDFVFQRPQHLISRLAQSRRVVWIEEPVEGDGPQWLEHSDPENVTIYRPQLPGGSRGFHADQLPALTALLRQLSVKEQLAGAIAWLYTPMALPLARTLGPDALVYDCMDELSLFRGAPPELVGMEQQLLDEADLVFTGGRSLFNAKKGRHPAVHCFPSSVDASHFRQAAPTGTAEQIAAQASIAHPRLGFFGVIDERLDIDLLEVMARTHPEWQIILVGPIVKIDPDTLPRQPNIHYFGQQSYEDLPRFLVGWDVCLLPFALNDATRFISPTKTLEYMAAERPIVSTPIRDVVDPYGGIVHIGPTAVEFMSGVAKALALTGEERSRIVDQMRAVVRETSWERTARQMETLVAACRRHDPGVRTDTSAPVPASTGAISRSAANAKSQPRGAGDVDVEQWCKF